MLRLRVLETKRNTNTYPTHLDCLQKKNRYKSTTAVDLKSFLSCSPSSPCQLVGSHEGLKRSSLSSQMAGKFSWDLHDLKAWSEYLGSKNSKTSMDLSGFSIWIPILGETFGGKNYEWIEYSRWVTRRNFSSHKAGLVGVPHPGQEPALASGRQRPQRWQSQHPEK